MMHARLTKEEFSVALKRGQGRVFLHAQQFGLADVADVVLDACLSNPVFDRQCESSRAPWLFRLFCEAPEYAWLSSKILEALKTPSDDHDIEHLCELAALMGKKGDAAAAAALREKVLGQTFTTDDDQYGCHALILLDGQEVAIEIARRFGALVIESPDLSAPPLNYLTDGTEILLELENRLQSLAATDPTIDAFWQAQLAFPYRDMEPDTRSKEECRQERRVRFREENPVEKILADIAAGVGSTPGRYVSFGGFATDAELACVLQKLVTETDEDMCMRLLWIFRRTPLPDLPPKIWGLAASANDRLRAAAIAALAQSCDARVGDFARARLQSPDFSGNESEILDLFVKNYLPGDEHLIMSVMRRLLLDEDSAHDFGSSILKICEENESEHFGEMLEWAYKINPCTICRHRLVSEMRDSGRLDPEIAAESLYDADEDTRELAREWLAQAVL
ncbi:hypothetical protein Q9Q94_13025 [Uliginosibacterium sp. 31-16]|uniref:hypothetical protein n=1 Tax=Uliginosibacterium sp. 31-16 TaxID=3068315 RepID=UPI00273D8D4A|nr:hypothetical protein [Uliginosibacterium sp. 31-16]MDP5240459.1 hypothetical protein [Uliginosibacterium sp. 31-16]